jgi:hypothetical protein
MSGEKIRGTKKANTGELPLRCLKIQAACCDDGVSGARFAGYPNSKCTEKNGADENKYDAHHQHIESQGKVHVRASHLDENKQA